MAFRGRRLAIRWQTNVRHADTLVELPDGATVADARAVFLSTSGAGELGITADTVKLGLAEDAAPLADEQIVAALELAAPLFLLEELTVPALTVHVRCSDRDVREVREAGAGELPAQEVRLLDLPLFADHAAVCEAAAEALRSMDEGGSGVAANPCWDSVLAVLTRSAPGKEHLQRLDSPLDTGTLASALQTALRSDATDALRGAAAHRQAIGLAVAFYDAGPPVAAFTIPLTIGGHTPGELAGTRSQLVVRADGKPWRADDDVTSGTFQSVMVDIGAALRAEAGCPCTVSVERARDTERTTLPIASLAGAVAAGAGGKGDGDEPSAGGGGGDGAGSSAERPRCRLVASLDPPKRIHVDLRTPCGTLKLFRAFETSDLVRKLRAAVVEKFCMPGDDFRLIPSRYLYGPGARTARFMQDDHALSDHGLSDCDRVLVFRNRHDSPFR